MADNHSTEAKPPVDETGADEKPSFSFSSADHVFSMFSVWLISFALIAFLTFRILKLLIKVLFPIVSPPLINMFSKTYNSRMGGIKRKLFADLAELQAKNGGKLTILEVGAGSGANFKYYPKGTRVIAVDPNRRYKKYLEKNAREEGHIKLDRFIVATGEEMTEIPDNSVGVVVSTLVMCSIKNPKAYVRGIKRVLKPGGKFYYMEHVSANKNSWTHLMQRMLNPVVGFCADGCQITRQSWRYIDEAGFSQLDYSHFMAPLKGILQVHRPHLVGCAIK